MWNGGTEVGEGWEGYEEDGAKNDMPLKKLCVPKTAPEISHFPQKIICTQIKTRFFLHHLLKKLFSHTDQIFSLVF